MALATVSTPSHSTVYLKADPSPGDDTDDDAPYVSLYSVGCICEFDAGKQGHSKGLLGIITTAEVRRVQIAPRAPQLS